MKRVIGILKWQCCVQSPSRRLAVRPPRWPDLECLQTRNESKESRCTDAKRSQQNTITNIHQHAPLPWIHQKIDDRDPGPAWFSTLSRLRLKGYAAMPHAAGQRSLTLWWWRLGPWLASESVHPGKRALLPSRDSQKEHHVELPLLCPMPRR